MVGRRLACVPPGRGRSPRSRYSRPNRGNSPPTVAAETPAGWVPPRTTGEVVVVANPVVVGSVLVVVGPVLVVVGPVVVVGSALVVVSRVVVDSTLEVETAVVVGAVMVGSGAVLGVVTGGCVVSLGSGASDVARRPAVVIGRLTAEGLMAGLLVGGEGAVAGSWVVAVKDVDVEVRAGSVVTVGSATPGARRGGSGWGSRVAEATRAARTAVVNPKATSSSLQGRRALARCRGRGVDMSLVPVRLFLPGQGCP